MVCFKVLIGLMCFYCASSWLDIEFFLKNVAISFFKVHYGTWMIVNLTLVVNIKHHHRNLEEQTVVFTDIKSLFFSGWVVYYGCQEKGGRHRLLTYLGFSSKPWMWSVVDVVIVHHVWVCVCVCVFVVVVCIITGSFFTLDLILHEIGWGVQKSFFQGQFWHEHSFWE